MTLLARVKEAGLPENFEVIHLFEGGSALHGARLEGKTDLDICGIFIEPAINALGLDSYEHFVTSTSDQTVRNVAGDVDVCLYSLRRWAMLATKGNPTAINYLFANTDAASRRLLNGESRNNWEDMHECLRNAIVAKSAAKHYVGFVDGQMRRLLGTGTGRHGQRAELTTEFGYDTKAAMHAVRLLDEGIELMRTGRVTLPRPNAGELIRIRQGAYSLDAVCSYVSRLREELIQAESSSKLQPRPDRLTVSAVVAGTYLLHYDKLRSGGL